MERPTVQVLERALDLLEELAESRSPVGLSDLSRRTGLSKTTVHRILGTLLERGYVKKTESGSYVIGPRLFNTLSYHINSLELHAEAKPHLHTLQKQLHLTVYLGVLDGPFVSVIEREASDRSDEVFTQVGRRLPAHCTSMGKCLLACLSSDELEEVLRESELVAHTAHTITRKRDLIQHLHEVRRRGWAFDNEESELNHRCLASPIYNYCGDAIAVIGVSGTKAELPDELIEGMAKQVVIAAERVSASMGYVA